MVYLSILSFLSRWVRRAIGVILFMGALAAVGGWLVAMLNPHPLASTWVPSILAVVLGTLAVTVALALLYMTNMMQAGLLGRAGVFVLVIGALFVAVGALVVDAFLLPGFYRMSTAIPDLLAPVQTAVNGTIGGINSSLSSITGAINKVGSGLGSVGSIFGGGGGSAFSVNAPSIANVTLPNIDGTYLVGAFLSAVGLPPLNALGAWGLTFLSGAPLALGCLLLGLALLRAGAANRSALSFLITCALLNLVCVFLVHIAFFSTVSSLLIFPALVWLGFTIWFPWTISIHLPWKLHLRLPRRVQLFLRRFSHHHAPAKHATPKVAEEHAASRMAEEHSALTEKRGA